MTDTANEHRTSQSAHRNTRSPQSLIISFDDNELVRELFGTHDQNLALIEDRLGVIAHPRGNQITLKGAKSACKSAEQVLTSLYEKLQQGQSVTPGDIDGAIRLAGTTKRARRTNKANDISIVTKRRVINPRSEGQAEYIEALANNELVFAAGPAGTGKTYLAVAAAAAALIRGDVDRIILSRPAVEAGERLGFLPGDLRDKVDPYLRPLYDALYDVLPDNQVTRGLEDGTIEIAPLAFMRGRTLAHAFVILDEAQNCTTVQMKMFLTRLGDNSRMVVTGDPSQVDLPRGIASGLPQAIEYLDDIKGIAHIRFNENDVVRHPLVSKIVKAYDVREKDQE